MTRRHARPVTPVRWSAGPGILLVLALAATPALAWMRPWYEDAVVVARSELIVVGQLVEGSIEFVPHKPRRPTEGASHEYHARLIVTEVLKGDLKGDELPVIIHYGLSPVVGGRVRREGFTTLKRSGWADRPEDAIEIFDTGSSVRGGPPLIKDARRANIWFLRRRGGNMGREPGNGDYGIVDPEDIQPASLKSYVLAYLSDDPEQAVTREMAEHPEIASRAGRYLDHRQILRVLERKDPGERVEKLLPFFIRGVTWGLHSEARDGLVACGDVAGPELLRLFRDPEHRRRRENIIDMWGKMRYRGCVDELIALLNEHDQFWATQELEPGWWNRDVGSARTKRRRDVYGEVYSAVSALGRIGDARACEAIEATRDRWRRINFDNPQIVEECDRALKTFAGER